MENPSSQKVYTIDLTPKRRKRLKFILGAAILAAILVTVLVYYAFFHLMTERYELSFERLPEAFDGFKIVQISDLHAHEFGQGNKTLLDLVAAEEPDIIMITGDFVEWEADLEMARTLCRGLSPIAPTYYVTGNHEWRGRIVPALREVLAETGVTHLRNSHLTLERGGERIILAGIDDPNGPRDQKTLDVLAGEIREEHADPFIVLLAHRNDRLSLYSENEIDLVFTGHAHGGFIRLPFTDGLIGPGARLFPTNTSGVVRQDDTVMVVSRGAGGRRFPLGNPPCLVSVTLKSAAGAQ